MTSPIGATSSTPAAQAATPSPSSALTATQPLGQDAFLKLLMAQLSNQDPLNPTDGTQFVTQLAQFSLVEQSKSQSSTLGNISTQLQGLSNAQATALVGKMVSIDGSSFAWDGSHAGTASITLSGAAQSVTASITDSQGKVVRTMDLGPKPAGALAIPWDGRDDAGRALPPGTYSLSVSAQAAGGQGVGVSQNVTGTVTSVSFAQGFPELVLSNGTTASLSQLQSVQSVASSAPNSHP